MQYVDRAGKAAEKPLSYSAVEKTFYSLFICTDTLQTPLSYRLEDGENPRELEKEQIRRLMNLIAQAIYVDQFDFALGAHRVESKVHKGEDIPEPHLRACRLSREEILHEWLQLVSQVISNYFRHMGKPFQGKKLFQYRFPEQLWVNIGNFVENLKRLPVWINRDLASSVFGGKQNYDYWQAIFETSNTPQGVRVLAQPLDLNRMIES
jgi:hypothetical protein